MAAEDKATIRRDTTYPNYPNPCPYPSYPNPSNYPNPYPYPDSLNLNLNTYTRPLYLSYVYRLLCIT